MAVYELLESNHPTLSEPVTEVTDDQEGREQIQQDLVDTMRAKNGIGLSANQIGIGARVFTMYADVKKKDIIVCFNPKIVTVSEEKVLMEEGCLSYPNQAIRTKRYRDVIIKTAQSESGWYFSGAEIPADESRGSWEVERKKKDSDLRLLESVCVQHEIDHLNGITIHDREIKLEPTKSEKKIGRNNLVTIRKGDAVKVLKYKKVQNLLNQGWVME